MKLTVEQEEVVSISGGRHLVLAPPGSGKTEMLSQRILRALANGVDPKRMLCATFTNRAAFEMRDRVQKSGSDKLPDVGNLHHFCHRFLLSVGRLRPDKHVLDEVEQLDFVKEVVDVLREELRDGFSRNGALHGISVIKLIDGTECEARRLRLSALIERHFSQCAKNGASPYQGFLSGALIAHQYRIGISSRYCRPMPESMYGFSNEGVLFAVAVAYSGLKRRFRSVDFDDLVNDTYLWLERNPLPEERKFLWVQIDEVQDLNPIQWRIVADLTSSNAVSVYFGDVEQAIFSFLGASSSCFADATQGCVRHYFKTNFRATPILLEILMRYSIDALASDWEFLPAPAVCTDSALTDSNASKVSLSFTESGTSVADYVSRMLSMGTAENVAILVRTNTEADVYETAVKPLGYRLAKVSGIDLFSYAPMRDFLAFVSLFNGSTSMTDWALLFRRFASGIQSRAVARYFVRDMIANGYDPMSLISESSFEVRGLGNTRRTMFVIRNLRRIKSMGKVLRQAFRAVRLETFRTVYHCFSERVFGDVRRYSLGELLPGVKVTDEMLADPGTYEQAVAFAHERIERFLRYTDHIYSSDTRSFTTILTEDLEKIAKLNEADLLVGDEKIVISTVHKAKGRQFDSVVVPYVADLLSRGGLNLTDEQRRLLYVAMSRAKRHLALFGVKLDAPEIACMKGCFENRYVSYYYRRESGPLMGDWLWRWERLAAMNAASSCDLSVVDEYVGMGSVPVARMAIKCSTHLKDFNESRTRLLEVVAAYAIELVDDFGRTWKLSGAWNWKDVKVKRSLIECCATAVDGLCKCRVFDHEAMSMVRCAALIADKYELANSVFVYLRGAFENFRSSALVVPDAVAVRGRDAAGEVVEAVGDFLYSRFPQLRFAAATALSEMGDGRWDGKISGSARDFEYLATVDDPSHEKSIRLILRGKLSDTYECRLRNILQSRAMRGFKVSCVNQF